MKTYLIAILLLSITNFVTAEDISHCEKSEKIIFNCQIENSEKIVSVCSSKEIADKVSYIQYRFGAPKKIELEFPKKKIGSINNFLFGINSSTHIANNSEDTEWRLSFNISSYNYVISEFNNSQWVQDENIKDDAGHEENSNYAVIKIISKNKVITLSCRNPYYSNLLILNQLLYCDKDSEFMGCKHGEQLEQ